MSRKKTTKEFIEEAEIIHGYKYDYSLVEYEGNKIKVKIICPKHGLFFQRPNDHLNGCGCKKCADELNHKKFSWTKEKFIEAANKEYNNFYDYSLVKYFNNRTKVKIICPKHGVFEQTPLSHLYSGGCIECGNELKILSNEKILDKIFNSNYKFKIVSRLGNRSSSFLIEGECKECGYKIVRTFSSWKYNINFCPNCNSCSSGEMLVSQFLTENKLEFEHPKKYDDLRDKNPLSYDFYIPSKNLLIECQGEQHYKPKNFGGIDKKEAEKLFHLQKHHDWLKRKYARNNKIELFEISYKEYSSINKVLSQKILTKKEN